MPRAERLDNLAAWALLVVVGLNLRPILASVSPLLADIRSATGMGFQTAALLTTLPVVCMGLVALLGVVLRLAVTRAAASLLLMALWWGLGVLRRA